MQFNSLGIQKLACDFVKEIINSSYYEADALEEIPEVTITALTGKSFKTKGKSDNERLAELNNLLNIPKQNDLLNKRLVNNCHVICDALKLSKACEPLLQLSALCTLNFGLADFISNHLYYTTNKHNLLISSALNMGLVEIEIATLAISKTGLFPHPCNEVLSILHLPKALVNNVVSIDTNNFKELVSGCFEVLPKSELSLHDYPHLNLSYLTEFMKQAVKQKVHGVNILIHGIAGTGKTELSKVLAHYCRSSLMTVKAQGEQYQVKKDELTSELNTATLRLQHYDLLQAMLAGEPNSMLIVDECEDVFFADFGEKKVSKDRLHQVLSDNALPTIWITNHIDQVEDSCIRRFSYVLEVPTPPATIKKQILSKPLKHLRVTPAFKESLSQIDDLTPAHVTQAANVARLINLTGKKAEQCIEEHIEQTLSACSLTMSKPRYQAEIPFDKQYINLKGDMNSIEELIKAVTTFDGTRALLFGPPGSGKTALVNHLAESLEQELITVKCSDVLGKYVGESEKNVAQIFRQAHQQNAILFLDEVDSLLSNRASLTNQFERQLVNEFLQQIQQSELTLFAATNAAESIDSAVRRRFDFKLTLTYLNQQQVLKLYQEVVGNISSTQKQQLLQMKHLTGGDFAIVARRNRLSKKPLTNAQNIQLLQEENNRKQQRKSIGFVQ
ncbi:ATP-binding protein [Colwellia sp. PAMC 21821]|uniref:AAA family ATPase n=1 Tax=Colwellia sp. PAMC 21821 TaxID=1816219 RepID=UPI0009BFBB00|nr:ATP-binding protein [Colwellia sp. PAMC 21821]ARD43812.1 hypothetical protein A3Q33_05495 [Colwellia sp. PAMC 21821]